MYFGLAENHTTLRSGYILKRDKKLIPYSQIFLYGLQGTVLSKKTFYFFLFIEVDVDHSLHTSINYGLIYPNKLWLF